VGPSELETYNFERYSQMVYVRFVVNKVALV